jgi:small-conductance mechanosensitive channel
VSWFKFGVVRGFLGTVVGLLVVALNLFGTSVVPTLPSGVQQMVFGTGSNLQYVNQTALQSVSIISTTEPNPLISIILTLIGLVISMIFVGAYYWIADKILDVVKADLRGYTKAITIGILGVLLVGLIVGTLWFFALQSLCTGDGSVVCYISSIGFGTLLAMMPIAIIMEIGFVSATWGIFRVMEWQLPT